MLLLEGGCAFLGLPLLRARRDAVRRELRGWRAIVLAAVMSALAYTLVLFAFRISKTGYVVAARELSIVLSAVIGSLWLREGRLGPRLAGRGDRPRRRRLHRPRPVGVLGDRSRSSSRRVAALLLESEPS